MKTRSPASMLSATLWAVAMLMGVAACDAAVLETSGEPPMLEQIDGPSLWLSEAAPLGLQTPSQEVLTELNRVRQTLQLAPARLNHPLQVAAEGHANFLAVHQSIYGAVGGPSPHGQSHGMEGFTGVDHQARALWAGYKGASLGDVIAHRPTGIAAVVSWLESLYHRLPLLRPQMEEIGYGEAGEGDGAVNVLHLGAVVDRVSSSPSGAPIVYPVAGAEGVPLQWDGNEVPKPIAPPGGYPSGPVFSAYYPTGAPADVVAVVMTEDGAERPATVLTAESDANLLATDVAVIPHEPLSPETTYWIRIEGSVDGEVSRLEWHVTTGGVGCDLLGEDCGPGRACYLYQGEPTCQWRGDGQVGETCEQVHDCAPGHACYGSRCVALCDPELDALGPNACVARCGEGVIAHPEYESVGICLPPSCLGEAHQCGAEEGCYWAYGFVCHWAGDGVQGDACESFNDCNPGYGCLHVEGVSACRGFCDGPSHPACEVVCAGDAPLIDEATGTRVCL